MLFSYNWLQSHFKKKLPEPRKLAELLTMHSFEVEGIHPVKSLQSEVFAKGKQFNRVKKIGKDYALDIDVTPNRPDCFSHLGIAKECAVLLKFQTPNTKHQTNSKFQIPKLKPKEDKKLSIKDFVEVKVGNHNDCPRYTGMVIKGVKVEASPEWMQARLKSCGVQPINNIVDAANYAMIETGQPIHAFDLDKVKNINSKFQIPNSKQIKNIKKIIIRRAKPGEKIDALDDKTYQLDKDILVIADIDDPLAIAGIKGGKKAAITYQTKNIFLESANFDPVLIRNASKKLKLRTDASFRFEHGLDPNLTIGSLAYVANLVQKTAGGKVAKGKIDIYKTVALPRKIRFNIDIVERLLGIKISKKEIISILKNLEFKIETLDKNTLMVKIPTIRKDIALAQDLVEEIGRIYGYSKITPSLPIASLLPPKKNYEIFWQNEISDILKGMGFFEVYNYSFISKDDERIWKNNLVKLENPISEEFECLRPSLLINLLKDIRKNAKIAKQIKIFEIGKVFVNKERITEKKMLSLVMTGSSFYEIKGVVDTLFGELGITDSFYDDVGATPEDSLSSFWNKNSSAEIKVGDREIGFLGKISKTVLKKMEITGDIFACDIELEKLIEEASEENEYQPISKFPAAIRDLAILVPLRTKIAEILNIINEVGEGFVRDVDLFDEYIGEEIPEGKKNLAFHIVYQAKDHTLSSEEISRIHKKIIKVLEKNPEWQVRQ